MAFVFCHLNTNLYFKTEPSKVTCWYWTALNSMSLMSFKFTTEQFKLFIKFIRELHKSPPEEWKAKSEWLKFESCPTYQVRFYYDKLRESQMCTITFSKSVYLPNRKRVRNFSFDADLIYFLLEYEE